MNFSFAAYSLQWAIITGLLVWACLPPLMSGLMASGARRAVLISVFIILAIHCILQSLALLHYLPLIVVPITTVTLLVLMRIPPAWWVKLTGARPIEEDIDEEIFSRIGQAVHKLQQGDIEGGYADLKSLRGKVSPRMLNYLEFWIGFAESERRRVVYGIPNPHTLEDISRETARTPIKPYRLSRIITAISVIVAVLIYSVPALALPYLAPEWVRDACVSSAVLAQAAEHNAITTEVGNRNLSELALTNPGEPVILLAQGPLTLEETAESQSDPESEEKLRAAGLTGAYFRDWDTSDGLALSVWVFKFGTHEGAQQFQRAVTRYACVFAEQSFRAGPGAVGLQVRYGSGPPIVEQVSWVDGSHRILVSRRFRTTPANHDIILQLAERTRQHFAGSGP